MDNEQVKAEQEQEQPVTESPAQATPTTEPSDTPPSETPTTKEVSQAETDDSQPDEATDSATDSSDSEQTDQSSEETATTDSQPREKTDTEKADGSNESEKTDEEQTEKTETPDSKQEGNKAKSGKDKEKKKKGGLAGTIASIIIYVIFLPILIFNCVLTIKTLINKDQLPFVFGYSPVVVTSGSMTPTFNKGDLVLFKEVDYDDLKAGESIICYRTRDERTGQGAFVTHRLIGIKVDENGKTWYSTCGDYTGSVDRYYGDRYEKLDEEYFISADMIQGVYVGKAEGVGSAIEFMRTPSGLLVFIAIPVAAYLLFMIFDIRRDYKDKIAELEQEIATLKAKLAKAKTKDESGDDESNDDGSPDDTPDPPPPDGEEIGENGESEEASALASEEASEQTESSVKSFQFPYNRSFTARLIQGGDDLQAKYEVVKNRLLGYKNVHSRVSWQSDAFTVSRNPIAKMVIKGKSLYLYLALTEEEQQQIKVDKVATAGKFASTPALIKLTGKIKLNRALKAIEVITARMELPFGGDKTESYRYEYETDEALLERQLVKKL